MKAKAMILVATTILGAGAGATAALAAGQRAHPAAARAARVKLEHTALGAILANGRGFTLYVFARDRRGHDACANVRGCSSVWPVLAAHGRTLAGAGVKSALLGSIKLGSGQRQVTYAGHPLYTYVADSGPGQTSYVGVNQFGGRWYAIAASGRIVR